jgi:hypothetical protein
MRRVTNAVLVAAVLGMWAVNVVGCAGALQEAKIQALSPAVQLAWPGVHEDALRGAADDTDRAALRAMAEAIDSGSCAEAARVAFVIWPEIGAMAARGIMAQREAAEIGPLGAQSKLERLFLFEEALNRCGDPTDPE